MLSIRSDIPLIQRTKTVEICIHTIYFLPAQGILSDRWRSLLRASCSELGYFNAEKLRISVFAALQTHCVLSASDGRSDVDRSTSEGRKSVDKLGWISDVTTATYGLTHRQSSTKLYWGTLKLLRRFLPSIQSTYFEISRAFINAWGKCETQTGPVENELRETIDQHIARSPIMGVARGAKGAMAPPNFWTWISQLGNLRKNNRKYGFPIDKNGTWKNFPRLRRDFTLESR